MIITDRRGRSRELVQDFQDIPLNDPYFNGDKEDRSIPPLIRNKAYFLGGSLEDAQRESLESSGRSTLSAKAKLDQMRAFIERDTTLPDSTKEETLKQLDSIAEEVLNKDAEASLFSTEKEIEKVSEEVKDLDSTKGS